MPSASTKKKRAAAAKAAAVAARPEAKAAAEEVDAAARPEAKAAAEEVDASNGSSTSEHSSQNSDVSSISGSVTGGNAAEGSFALAAGGGFTTPSGDTDVRAKKAKQLTKISAELHKFARKAREHATDAETDNGAWLESLTGQGQTKLDPLPEHARLLLDALQGKTETAELNDILTPIFLENLRDSGVTTKSIAAAISAVESLIVTRNGIDKWRMVELTARLKQSASGGAPVDGGGAVNAADGSVGAQESQGPATDIVVVFDYVDKDSYKARQTFPPTDNNAEARALAKQMLVSIVTGKQAKLGETVDTFARLYGTAGVPSQELISTRKSVSDSIRGGTYQFGAPGAGSTGAGTGKLIVHVADSKRVTSTSTGYPPLSTKFTREDHFAAEDEVMANMKKGSLSFMGSKREGPNIVVNLAGHSHRTLNARALLQEKTARALLEEVDGIKWPDGQTYSTVTAMTREYKTALDNPTEKAAIRLASASEFGCEINPEALVLSKAAIPYMNIATNMLQEFMRLVCDDNGTKYLSRISKLARMLPKRGESLQDHFGNLEDERKSLLQLQMPEMDFSALGYSVNPTTGVPVILDTSNLTIQMTVDHAYYDLPRSHVGTRIREVFTANVLKAARTGKLSAAKLEASFRECNDLRISLVLAVPSADPDKAQTQRQIGAFAAGKTLHAPGDKGNVKGSVKPQAFVKSQDRGRSHERSSSGVSKPQGNRSRSPSQQGPMIAHYKKAVAHVTKFGALSFLQILNNQCTKSGEAIVEVDQKGNVIVPIQLTAAHTWGHFGGQYGLQKTVESEVFASLMLLRDICGRASTLTKTGAQYGVDYDTTWSKAKACSLRGDLIVADTNDKSGGKGKGKGRKTITIAASASRSLFGDDLGWSGDEE